GQTQIISRLPAKANQGAQNRLTQNQHFTSAVEMPARGNPRKTKIRFSSAFHRPWKSLRDSHISTAQATIFVLIQNQRKESQHPRPGLQTFRPVLGLENAPSTSITSRSNACSNSSRFVYGPGVYARDEMPACESSATRQSSRLITSQKPVTSSALKSGRANSSGRKCT